MSETTRLADQIRRAYDGDAWHGDSLYDILLNVNAKQAAARPIPNAHSIWELVNHIAAWDAAIVKRIGGAVLELEGEENFPPVPALTGDALEDAWRKTVRRMQETNHDLAAAVANFPDSRLTERVPGKTESYHDFYYSFAGIVQHELYHAGQIALLKKAQAK